MATCTSVGDLESICPVYFQGVKHSIEVFFLYKGAAYAKLSNSSINSGTRYRVHLDLYFKALPVFVFYVLRSTNALEISFNHYTES